MLIREAFNGNVLLTCIVFGLLIFAVNQLTKGGKDGSRN